MGAARYYVARSAPSGYSNSVFQTLKRQRRGASLFVSIRLEDDISATGRAERNEVKWHSRLQKRRGHAPSLQVNQYN